MSVFLSDDMLLMLRQCDAAAHFTSYPYPHPISTVARRALIALLRERGLVGGWPVRCTDAGRALLRADGLLFEQVRQKQH